MAKMSMSGSTSIMGDPDPSREDSSSVNGWRSVSHIELNGHSNNNNNNNSNSTGTGTVVDIDSIQGRSIKTYLSI